MNLSEQEDKHIDSQLENFQEKSNGLFSIFIINKKQGRGLDFISNLEIESNGGVFLIVGVLPSSYLELQQFIGRTGRIGNKGQYRIVIQDKSAINTESQLYIKTKMLELQNEDILVLNKIKNQTFNMGMAPG